MIHNAMLDIIKGHMTGWLAPKGPTLTFAESSASTAARAQMRQARASLPTYIYPHYSTTATLCKTPMQNKMAYEVQPPTGVSQLLGMPPEMMVGLTKPSPGTGDGSQPSQTTPTTNSVMLPLVSELAVPP